MRHVTHRNESCHIYKCDIHTNHSFVHTSFVQITHSYAPPSYKSSAKFMCVCIWHGSIIYLTGLTHTCDMSHLYATHSYKSGAWFATSQGKHLNESCHTYESWHTSDCVMSHVCMSHVTYMIESSIKIPHSYDSFHWKY